MRRVHIFWPTLLVFPKNNSFLLAGIYLERSSRRGHWGSITICFPVWLQRLIILPTLRRTVELASESEEGGLHLRKACAQG